MRNNSMTSATPATPGTFDFYSASNGGRWVASAAATTSSRLQKEAELSEEEEGSDEERRGRNMLRDPPLPTRMPKEERFKRTRSSSTSSSTTCSRCCPSSCFGLSACSSDCSLGRCCDNFLTRFSLASFFACVCCVVGGIMFAICSHSAADTTLQLMQEAFHMTYSWMETYQIILTSLGCLIVALSLTVWISSFVMGFSAATDTARKPGREQPASRVTPLVFIALLFPALPVWMALFAASLFGGVINFMLDGVCNTPEVAPIWQVVPPPSDTVCKTILEGEDCVDCIDLYQFNFMFPSSARKEDMWLCGREIWLLCSSNLPSICTDWIFCIVACFLVVLGISVHLFDLSHARTMLGEERNRRDLEEMQYINKRVSRALLGNGKGAANGSSRRAGGSGRAWMKAKMTRTTTSPEYD